MIFGASSTAISGIVVFADNNHIEDGGSH